VPFTHCAGVNLEAVFGDVVTPADAESLFGDCLMQGRSALLLRACVRLLEAQML
jgi:hypothetical protein